MKRAFLPCLLLGLMALAGAREGLAAHNDFYVDLHVGTGNRYNYPDRYYRPGYQPYNDLRQWVYYLDDRWYQYDRWWRAQSRYFRDRTRMQHDYGAQLRYQMKTYQNWQTVQQMEQFFRRYYDPYAYSYSGNNNYYRDPYYGGSQYYRDDYSYYPDNYYYDNAPRRQYYGNNYYYDRFDREAQIYSYGTGHGITDIVRGSNRGNDLQTWSGSLTTIGNILGIVSNERDRSNYEDFGRGRYYR